MAPPTSPVPSATPVVTSEDQVGLISRAQTEPEQKPEPTNEPSDPLPLDDESEEDAIRRRVKRIMGIRRKR